MAQLIKLQDYVSRYEWDVYRYPTQYIRVKKDNWNKLYRIWSEPPMPEDNNIEEYETDDTSKVKKVFTKFKSLVKKEQIEEDIDVPKENILPETEQELKQYFLNKIFNFQLKWATSTITEISYVDQKYYQDRLLKYFLQRLPDTYLLMYYPVFNIKKAPVDGEIILITPIGIEIIYFIEKEPGAVIMAGDERAWTIESAYEQSRMLSPVIALKRTEKIIKSILQKHTIDFPIKKTVLSRTNNIIFNTEPYQINLIGKQKYNEWFHHKRILSSPLKSRQLKAADALLGQCYSNFVKRPEWEDDISLHSIGDMEE
ncbi:NERD domain-containing protein [Oceanobacillus bengalensis]|uniref:NERD domain-containing protein n=1 Tax=Oceanobacillus bengalensis TaxID=1435466 RepID=A0A494YXX6_9BACI|nr:NERD domain-containing protein [Oceanobacillus bengalensis]RKQ14554.1 NERD domain-containing protein [Oceanobacillus bengalensis]